MNLITDSTALAIDPNLEPERRVQSLLHVWFRNYFSGAAFTNTSLAGAATQHTFLASEIGWQEDKLPTLPAGPHAPVKPFIHAILPDRGQTPRDYTDDQLGYDEKWTVEIMVRVPKAVTGTPFSGQDPEHVCRRAADQISWLLNSSERNALPIVGIFHLTQVRPPTILPATNWSARILIATLKTRRELPR